MENFALLTSLVNEALGLPTSRERVYPAGVDQWVEVLEVAKGQRMLPLVVSLFDRVPEAFQPKGKPVVGSYVLSEQLVGKAEERLAKQRKLALLFQKHGLDVMFLKGWTLALRYPDPMLRVYGDIDYYLFGHSKEGERVLMEELGLENSPYYHHHTQATWKGTLLENHYDFMDRENHACNWMLDDALKGLAASEGHSRPLDFGDETLRNAYRMTPTMEALFLMRHMSGHFVASGMELRQLYDWILLLYRDGDQVDWPQVRDLFDKSGMLRFARMVSWIIAGKLCVQLPDYLGTIDGAADEQLAGRIWDDMVHPTGQDPYRRGTLRYYLRESSIFLQNRWKHRLVYPSESYFGLMLNLLRLKLKLGR